MQDDGVGDQIGRHHPGGLVLADAHAAGDIAQRDIGDRCVEHLHERGARHQERDQPWIGAAARAAWTGVRRSTAPASARAARRGWARIDADRRLDRHARAKRHIGGAHVEHDLHRHALHDLDVVAGGVLRRQQREGGAGARLHARDMAFERVVRIGVDVMRHLLARGAYGRAASP